MSNDKPSSLVYTTVARIQGEKATMITESRIELLEKLAGKALSFEKIEPSWNIFKTGRSVFSTAFGIAVSCLIPELLKNKGAYLPSNLMEWTLHFCCYVGFFGMGLCQFIIYTNSKIKDEAYKSNITDIIDILQKMKSNLDGQTHQN